MSSTQEVGEIFGTGSGPAHSMLRSPTVLIVSVGLWGMNIFFFQLFGIRYKYVLNYDLMQEQQQRQQHSEGTASNLVHNNINSGNISVLSRDDDDEGEEYYYDAPVSSTSDDTSNTTSNNITWGKLVTFSVIMLFILHYSTHYWIDHLGRGLIGAVVSFYGCMFIYIFLPISSNRWLRRSFVIVLQRTFELVNPRCSCITRPEHGPRPIPFIDVFFADAMCSLSKVFFDWGMLLHMASHFPEPVPPAVHNIIIPSACAAVPYFIRARQCMIMHTVGRLKNDPKRYQHIANAIKYSTSIFPLCMSAYQKTIDPADARKLEPVLIMLLLVNSLYALYWDIVMDWGMMQNPTSVVHGGCSVGTTNEGREASNSCRHGLLRPQLRFGLAMSTLILAADSLLRFSWLLRFVTSFPNNDSFVLCTQFLEVFRRAIWNLLRVEWEQIKQRTRNTKVRDLDEEMTSLNTSKEERQAFLGPKVSPMATVTPVKSA